MLKEWWYLQRQARLNSDKVMSFVSTVCPLHMPTSAIKLAIYATIEHIVKCGRWVAGGVFVYFLLLAVAARMRSEISQWLVCSAVLAWRHQLGLLNSLFKGTRHVISFKIIVFEKFIYMSFLQQSTRLSWRCVEYFPCIFVLIIFR